MSKITSDKTKVSSLVQQTLPQLSIIREISNDLRLLELHAYSYYGYTMSKDEFDSLCDSFRSPHLWKKENGEWSLRSQPWD